MNLTLSDVIAVEFETERGDNLTLNEPAVLEHESMARKRPVEELKLEDCIEAFHQSELLDDENPWHCPSCRSNQRAHKSLSIWRSPPTLMVYLKRFVFHDMMPLKVDDAVSFPMELQLKTLLKNAGPAVGDRYNLEGVICHCGGEFRRRPISSISSNLLS